MALYNLWDNIEENTEKSPISIMEEAVDSFNEKTLKIKKDVYFRLQNNHNCLPGLCRVGLYLVAPELNGYSSLVLTVEHRIEQIYPCQICDWMSSAKPGSSFVCDCDSADDFELQFTNIISDPVLQNSISTMLSLCSVMSKNYHGLPRATESTNNKQ